MFSQRSSHDTEIYNYFLRLRCGGGNGKHPAELVARMHEQVSQDVQISLSGAGNKEHIFFFAKLVLVSAARSI
jgi:hypothetical protein